MPDRKRSVRCLEGTGQLISLSVSDISLRHLHGSSSADFLKEKLANQDKKNFGGVSPLNKNG
jgi:hypothetical protein